MREPTTAELKRAYQGTGLSLLRIGFDKAMSIPAIRTALRCKAQSTARRTEQHQGKPAPVQPALI